MTKQDNPVSFYLYLISFTELIQILVPYFGPWEISVAVSDKSLRLILDWRMSFQ